MARELAPIDISNIPDLIRIVEEARTVGAPRVLERGNEPLAVLTPVLSKSPSSVRVRAEADLRAFRSAAGSWKDFDADTFNAANEKSRRRSSRPPVDL